MKATEASAGEVAVPERAGELGAHEAHWFVPREAERRPPRADRPTASASIEGFSFQSGGWGKLNFFIVEKKKKEETFVMMCVCVDGLQQALTWGVG